MARLRHRMRRHITTYITVIEKPVNLRSRSSLTKHLVDPGTTTDDGGLPADDGGNCPAIRWDERRCQVSRAHILF